MCLDSIHLSAVSPGIRMRYHSLSSSRTVTGVFLAISSFRAVSLLLAVLQTGPTQSPPVTSPLRGHTLGLMGGETGGVRSTSSGGEVVGVLGIVVGRDVSLR